MSFQLHDLVRVKHQPKHQPCVLIEGLIAVITELDGDYATIYELDLTGELWGGTGVVELECLEKPFLSAPWRAAYAVYRQNCLRQEISLDEDNDEVLRREEIVKKVAESHGLSANLLFEMLKEIGE